MRAGQVLRDLMPPAVQRCIQIRAVAAIRERTGGDSERENKSRIRTQRGLLSTAEVLRARRKSLKPKKKFLCGRCDAPVKKCLPRSPQ
jgi:hypothetical protein